MLATGLSAMTGACTRGGGGVPAYMLGVGRAPVASAIYCGGADTMCKLAPDAERDTLATGGDTEGAERDTLATGGAAAGVPASGGLPLVAAATNRCGIFGLAAAMLEVR